MISCLPKKKTWEHQFSQHPLFVNSGALNLEKPLPTTDAKSDRRGQKERQMENKEVQRQTPAPSEDDKKKKIDS